MNNLTNEQQKVLNILKQGKNVLLTGPAGVGKSFIINEYKKYCIDNDIKVAITATTGSAGLLIGGCTLHSWAGIGKGDGSVDKLVDLIKNNIFSYKRWISTKVLVIDEVSMLHPDLFDKLDLIGKNIRKKNYLPFGGIQLILCGDFLQLPVVKCDRYCFESDKWNNTIHHVIELTTIMRQSDPTFQKCLMEIRHGLCSPETYDILVTRVNENVEKNGIKPTQLYSNNASVDNINEQEFAILREKNHEIRRYKAVTTVKSYKTVSNEVKKLLIDRMDRDCMAVTDLELAIDAQVMVLANLSSTIVNGSRCVVIDFDIITGYPIVRFMNGSTLTMEPYAWSMELEDGTTVKKYQVPLKLAYASTIHKAQGQSFDCCIMDLGPKIFDYGQTYTALSRVKTLEGLSLINFDPKKVKANPKALLFYANIQKIG